MTTTTTEVRRVQPGEPVIHWSHTMRLAWMGEHDTSGFEQLRIGVLTAGLTEVRCSFERVAPDNWPVPLADERVHVDKLPRKPFAHAAGPWELVLPGPNVAGEVRKTYHRTKREAVEAGLRRLAILDYHAALKAQESPVDELDPDDAAALVDALDL